VDGLEPGAPPARGTRSGPRPRSPGRSPLGPAHLPVKPRPHGRRGLGVRAPCGTRHPGEQGERCGGVRWASGMRKARSQWLWQRDRPAGVSPAPRGMPFGDCGTGYLAGLRRQDGPGCSMQGQRKPPVLGRGASAYGTTDSRKHTGDTRPWNSAGLSIAPLQSVPATSWQREASYGFGPALWP
jgi:hypothetical protein